MEATTSTVKVIQNPDKQIQPTGSTTRLNCSVGNIFMKMTIAYWYKQGQDGRWNFLCTAFNGSKVEGRYFGGVKGHGNYFYLQIEYAEMNDSGIYFCAVKHVNRFFFGNGSTLIISDDVAGSPSLLILAPTEQETNSDHTVTLICLVADTLPQWSPIQWNISGEVIKALEDAGTFDKDGFFSIRSQVSIPLQTWNSPATFFCQVTSIHVEELKNKTVMDTGNKRDDCPLYILYFGLPPIITLAMIILLLHRRRQKRGSISTEMDRSNEQSHCFKNIEQVPGTTC
ncbi:immunoglobulin kappa light chain-like [Protopterus annectens]|uniref:immunoglobulin kappa light chain-like n=1 Tax=Protopterus annectens TaxID=7888 RepID=UPI001CFC29A5|nr:immunoglobulin kappa light chain-like [Protopterus annectens]